MTTCQHCGQAITPNQLLCPHCQRPQALVNHYTSILALPFIGLALGVMLTYWILSQLLWLPFTQPLFYIVADSFGLAYKTTQLENQTFFNGAWLIGGALLYIPLVTYSTLRFGFKKTLTTAFFGSLPFAFLDNWAWSAVNRPGPLQFIIVLVIAAVLITVLHFLFIYLVDRWPIRFALIRAQAVKPGNAISRAATVRLKRTTLTPLEADSPIANEPEPQPIENREPSPPALEPQPTPQPEPKPVPTPEPKPVPQSGVNESAPPAFTVEDDESAPTRQGGLPAWLIVVGLGILILIGIVLIYFAIQT